MNAFQNTFASCFFVCAYVPGDKVTPAAEVVAASTGTSCDVYVLGDKVAPAAEVVVASTGTSTTSFVSRVSVFLHDVYVPGDNAAEAVDATTGTSTSLLNTPPH